MMSIFKYFNTLVFVLLTFYSCSEDTEENIEIIDENHHVETSENMSIELILAMEDHTEAVIELDEQLNEKTNYGEDLSKLTESEKTVLFIENLEIEVNNGGFHQFYSNSSGDYSLETYEALLTIGADSMAKIMNDANSILPNKTIPSNRTERINILEEHEDQLWDKWEECDSKFYEYPDDLIELLYTFISKNKADF
ncbi:MAG: DMP19 family protein [Crocinitomicaceae bacterium]|nr:DMP19 family protein [Crocinitomicaceae bacterium]